MKLQLLMLLLLVTPVVSATVTIYGNVTIQTGNINWTFNNITVDNITVMPESLTINNDRLALSTNKPADVVVLKHDGNGASQNNFSINTTLSNTAGLTVTSSGSPGIFVWDNQFYYHQQSDLTFNGLTFWQYGSSYQVTVNIYDQNTLTLINTTNVTLRITNDDYEDLVTTSTGVAHVNLTVNDLHAIRVSATGYGTRTYSITPGEGLSQTLNAYLTQFDGNVTFHFIDKSSGQRVEEVLVTMSQYFNNSWVVVSNKETDVVGNVVFGYEDDVKYCFLGTKINYLDKQFCLDKIESDEYNILFERSSTSNETIIDDDVVVVLLSSVIKNDHTSWAQIRFYSPRGSLSNYYARLTYNGSSNTETGNDVYGEVINVSKIIVGAQYGDTMTITASYRSTLNNDYVTRTWLVPISGYEQSTGTLEGWKAENLTGMSARSLAIIATIIILVVAGLAGAAGSIIGETGITSMAAGILFSGIFAYLNWLPNYLFYAVAFIGGMYIATRIGGHNG